MLVGNDLSVYGDDEELNLVENGAILSTIANFKRIAPGVREYFYSWAPIDA